jgi:hypothetical protein
MHVVADVPRLKAMWTSYLTTYELDALLVPTTHITARPIDDVEPYATINGRKVQGAAVHSFKC